MTTSVPRRRLVARLAATALAAAVAVVALPATAHAATPITDGHLDWGVKESFRKYVTGPIGGGKIEVSDGATTNDDGSFRFGGGTGEYDPQTHDITTAFDGTVQFLAHGSGSDWALDLTITQLRLNTAGDGGEIVADVTSKDRETGEFVEYDDVALAELDLTGISPETGSDGFTTLADIPATLTAEGEAAFGGFYTAGTALDPATVSVKAEAGGDPTEPSDGSIKDGYVDWGVKKSFRDYITGPIAKGKIDLADGATETDSGYQFPKATGAFDDGADTLTAAVTGSVRFRGHESGGEYELDLTFTELSVSIEDGAGILRVGDVDLAELDTPGELTPDGDVLSLTGLPATLTTDGAEFFGGYYEAGQELDPVTVQIALSEDAELPAPGGGEGGSGSDGPGFSSGSLPITGASLPTTAGIAVALLAAGAVALWRTRVRVATRA